MRSQLVRFNVVVCVIMGLMAQSMETGWAAKSQQQATGGTMMVAQAGSVQPDKAGAIETKPVPSTDVPGAATGFTIKEFVVEGSDLLSQDKIIETVGKYRGPGKQMADLEQARAELEKAYQALGFPTVLVTIPEQTIEAGTVRMLVTEGRLLEIKITGNNYYPRLQILEKLPSLRPGNLIEEKVLVKELDAVNVNPDLKVTPVLKASSEPGLVDLELKVKDRFPMHAKLTGDNKGPLTTPANRLTAEVSYSNLWHADHILSVQTTQTPEDWGAVQAYGFSYVVPISGPQHSVAVYASKVKSTSVLAGTTLAVSPGNVSVAGNATIAGFRYFFPILQGGTMTHLITMGVDYKRLEQTEATFPGGLGTAVVLGPIEYTPVSLSYSAGRPDSFGAFDFSATAKGYWPVIPGGEKEDFAGDPNDPFGKPGQRNGSTGKFFVLQSSMNRSQPLPHGFHLALHADGQWANEPLVPAEAYFAGGADTVRGYIANEAIGDYAVRGRAELYTPWLPEIPLDRFWQRRKSSDVKINWRVLAFYDAANLWIAQARAGQRDQFRLEGVGGGIRAQLVPYNLNFQLDQGLALSDATVTREGDTFVHFLVSIAY
jgi:hemolysin activation/secretion protein